MVAALEWKGGASAQAGSGVVGQRMAIELNCVAQLLLPQLGLPQLEHEPPQRELPPSRGDGR